MYRFRFSHFAVCAAALACGVTAGRMLYIAYGAGSLLSQAEGNFFSLFLDSFYTVLLPMVLLFTLSVTVYCAPAAIGFLCFRSLADGYFIFSYLELMKSADKALCIFAVAVHAFYTYGYFLLAMRCLYYRSRVRLLPCTTHTVFRSGSMRFYGDFTSVAGTITLCGLFSSYVLR